MVDWSVWMKTNMGFSPMRFEFFKRCVRTSFSKIECLVDIAQGADQSALDHLVHEDQPVGVDIDMEFTLGWQADA